MGGPERGRVPEQTRRATEVQFLSLGTCSPSTKYLGAPSKVQPGRGEAPKQCTHPSSTPHHTISAATLSLGFAQGFCFA